MYDSAINPDFLKSGSLQHFPADAFPTIHPIHWLTSHFAVGGWSPLNRLSGMLTAHMTRIAPQSGFTWHPHRGLEIYTWVLEGTLYHEDTTGGKGEIMPGEIQRMFSGMWIEHQELNLTDDPVRVIQIWYVASAEHIGLQPHYQQVVTEELPVTKNLDGTVYNLIGDGSPMDQHMSGRLTAAYVSPGGKTELEPPRSGEDLFLYITDGTGTLRSNGNSGALGQYDVIMARPDATETILSAAEGERLDFLSFYLPSFLSAG